MITNSFGRRIGACIVAIGALALAACSSSSSTSGSAAEPSSVLVVGLDNDQSRLLTEIYAQALEKAGFRVGRKDPVADLAAGYAALKAGQADLFVTYSGQLLAHTASQETAAAASTTIAAATTTIETTTTTIAPTTTLAATTTTAIVGPVATTAPTATTAAGSTATTTAVSATTTTLGPPVSSGAATAARVTGQVNALGEILPKSLQFGAPAIAQDKGAIYCSKLVATTNSLATFGDLAGAAARLTLGATADFSTGDPFGSAGFTKVYGATFKSVTTLDAGKVAEAIAKGTVDCGVMDTLDIGVTADMSILEDDRGLAIDEAIVPLLSSAGASPGATQIIDSVSAKLLTGDLREMLRRISVDKQAPNVVAGAWLSAAGLAGK